MIRESTVRYSVTMGSGSGSGEIRMYGPVVRGGNPWCVEASMQFTGPTGEWKLVSHWTADLKGTAYGSDGQPFDGKAWAALPARDPIDHQAPEVAPVAQRVGMIGFLQGNLSSIVPTLAMVAVRGSGAEEAVRPGGWIGGQPTDLWKVRERRPNPDREFSVWATRDGLVMRYEFQDRRAGRAIPVVVDYSDWGATVTLGFPASDQATVYPGVSLNSG